MNKQISLATLAGGLLLVIGCQQAPMAQFPGPANPNLQAQGALQNNGVNSRPKQETPLVENRKVTVPTSSFDQVAERSKGKTVAADPLYKAPAARNPFDNPYNSNMPFRTFSDLLDHIRYGYNTVYEDNKYMYESQARQHFNRYINSSYMQVQSMYKASREEMKRFILLDTLVNSLTVDSRPLSYMDTHNPPSQAHYKLLPTQAAVVMPSFGEIVSYNRNSYDVNYERWDIYKAARYYQANYSRIMGLVMEYGPSKQDCWRMVHREITSYANY